MVATASVVSKFTLGPLSMFVDGKLIRDKVRFYMKQLDFPEEDSDEYEQLSEDLKERIGRFQPKSHHLLQWTARRLVTKTPFTFVNSFLKEILDEMEQIGLDILKKEAAN